ncbi:MAG: hypothetical protein JXQ99_15715 [Hyphomicrobiaceae bacterium]
MTDTAVSIGCRKTIEVAGRLSAWLERSDVLASEIKPVISTATERATLDLRRVMHSIDFAPCVGLVGSSDRDKLQLASSSLFQPGATTINELTDLRYQQHDVRSIFEQVVGDDLGAAVRFRNASTRISSNDGYRFPIQIELLSTLDIAKIIVAAYYAHFPSAVGVRLQQDDIQQAINRADSDLSTAAISGLSSEDIYNLRQHLWAEFPRLEGLRTLSTSGYWDWLSKHIAHLPTDGRCHILSCLWHFEPRFTTLFQRLTNALREFGFARRVRVPIEAVLGTDPETGGIAPHLASIVRRSTIGGVLQDNTAESDIGVSIGQGIVRTTSRTVIAALAHTMTLRVSRAAPYPLEQTDLKIFPSPPPLRDLSLRLATLNRAAGEPGPELAEKLYVRSKSAYLFSRACTHNELAAIIFLADANGVPDDTHMRSISDWIELSEGPDPRARERMENCLSILIKTHAAWTLDEDFHETALPNDDNRREFLADLLGENNRWAQEWTPGRPFSQIHFVPGFANPASHATPTRTNMRSATADDGAFPTRLPAPVKPTAATRVLLDLAGNSSQVIRTRQIRSQLATIKRALQARMFRYHRSNNPAQFTDWRRQIANVASKRLEACANAHQLGTLLGILTLSEAEAHILLSGLHGSATDYQESADHPTDITIAKAALPDPEVCAEAVVAAWLKLMYEAAGSRHLCNELNIAQAVFQHMIDEVVIGVHRTDLVGALATKFVRTLEASNPRSNLPRSYAVVAARTLGGFLERLTVAQSQRAVGAQPLSASSAAPFDDLPRRDVISTQRLQTDDHTRGIDPWPTLFRRMVEDNIVAAEGLTAHSEADHELGEYLSMLTSNSLEVEL